MKSCIVMFMLVVCLPVYAADCPYDTNLPCYRPLSEFADTDIPRRSTGFSAMRGFQSELIKARHSRGGRGVVRSVSPHFFKSLKMPCGYSSAFPDRFKCDDGLQKNVPAKLVSEDPPLVFPKAKRGEVEVIEKQIIEPPDIATLAPEHVGLSLDSQPSFYWFLSKPWQGALEFSLVHADNPEESEIIPLKSEKGFDAGIHGVSLSEHDITLKPGVKYEWFVSLVIDSEQRAGDLVASGAIEYRAQVATRGEKNIKQLAEMGAWYDAIDRLSRQIDKKPENTLLRRQRAALLHQVDLKEVVILDKKMAHVGK